MEKKYQVFVSSTFRDLIDERQAVMRALLELGHMPAGMELFPATDDAAWELIKSVIDESDYYLLVIGGRYGSLDEAGLGFTEREYDYAVSVKKPVSAFLHKSPGGLPRDNTETDPDLWEKLQGFRKKVEKNHHCKYWDVARDLHADVAVAMSGIARRSPAIGWIRADQLPVDFSVEEMLRLQAKVRELEQELDVNATEPPKGTEDLAQGADLFEVSYACNADVDLTSKDRYGNSERAEFDASGKMAIAWNDIFSVVAPSMTQQASEQVFYERLKTHLTNEAQKLVDEDAEREEKIESIRRYNIVISAAQLETCLVQFRALGLIHASKKRRSVTDRGTYWSLTPYGDSVLVKLRAIRKNEAAPAVSTSVIQ